MTGKDTIADNNICGMIYRDETGVRRPLVAFSCNQMSHALNGGAGATYKYTPVVVATSGSILVCNCRECTALYGYW